MTKDEIAQKRRKAEPEEVNPMMLMVEIQHKLEARIAELERRVRYLENRPRAVGEIFVGGAGSR